MDAIEKNLLRAVADLHDVPTGAYNIRENGAAAGRRSTEHIRIETKSPASTSSSLPRRKTRACTFPFC